MLKTDLAPGSQKGTAGICHDGISAVLFIGKKQKKVPGSRSSKQLSGTSF